MSNIERGPLTVEGAAASCLAGGAGVPILFLHGGGPRTPYAAGAHLWGNILERFSASGARVVAPDLPGFGRTPLAGAPSFDGLVRFAMGLARTLDSPAHVVGHDEGGLIALCMALEAPEAVRSVTVVSSIAAAPSGDGLENLTLAYPPEPVGGRSSQAWALERLSFARWHITAELLDACVEAAVAGPFQAMRAAPVSAFVRELMGAKARLYEAYRTAGVPVPVQLVWGDQDPISTLDHALTLHRLIGAKQPATQAHIVNRVGYFPFREEPEQFHRLVMAFIDGLAEERAAA